MKYQRVALAGLGPHARRIYLPLLAELVRSGQISFECVFEKEDKRAQTEALLASAGLGDVKKIFVQDVAQDLARTYRETPFDCLLVSTEPRSRMEFYEFALARGVAVLTDKPVLAPENIAHDLAIAQMYPAQIASLEERFRKKGVDFCVQAQRREHAGYQHIRNYLDDFIRKFSLPVTEVSLHHADGMWVLPDEWERDYHPYKYGFGKLFHSGYHFVDLLCWLLEPSGQVDPLTRVMLSGRATWPAETLGLWSGSHLLPPQRRAGTTLTTPGEYDVHALLQFFSEKTPVTTAVLQLLQHSFSDRDPAKVVTDVYKGIGRVRHERLDLKVSSLLNIQVHSYQSASRTEAVPGKQVGERDHFEVLIFRNTAVCGGENFRRLFFDDAHDLTLESHNEQGRERLLKKFLRGEAPSPLRDHLATAQLISLLYQMISAQGAGFGTAEGEIRLRPSQS